MSVAALQAPRRRARLVRTSAAVTAGRIADRLSRTLHLGRGAVIGGRVAMTIDGQVLGRLTAGRPVTIVTGTNGKTTTTRLLSAAIAVQRTVSATRGANMPAGLVAPAAERTDEIVLEVDELYVPRVLLQTRPRVLVLLNLTRDQLDRMVEIRSVAALWRTAIAAIDWAITIVANVDDPLLVWAVGDHRDVVWVAAGYRWQQDAALCPQCDRVRHVSADGEWTCECGFDRPDPQWTLTPDALLHDAIAHPFELRLPGEMNRSNAAVAVAAAVARGIDAGAAIGGVERVESVAGRYLNVDIDGRHTRLLLAKNPASWTETLDLLDRGSDPIVICVNAKGPDGRDTSWLWDVPFERLAGRTVGASGERHWDLALRLQTAGVDCGVATDPLDAVRTIVAAGANVELVGTYTAFHDLLERLDVRW